MYRTHCLRLRLDRQSRSLFEYCQKHWDIELQFLIGHGGIEMVRLCEKFRKMSVVYEKSLGILEVSLVSLLVWMHVSPFAVLEHFTLPTCSLHLYYHVDVLVALACFQLALS